MVGRHFSWGRLLQLWQSHAMEQLDSTSYGVFDQKSIIRQKNCSGVVAGGFLGCNHQKGKRAETTHKSHLCKYRCLVHSRSSDKRWAIREAGARIDRIWVLSSTHWAGDSSVPSSGLFCQHHLYWPSRMMTTGAVSGLLHLREPLCLSKSFCLSKSTDRLITLELLCTL